MYRRFDPLARACAQRNHHSVGNEYERGNFWTNSISDPTNLNYMLGR